MKCKKFIIKYLYFNLYNFNYFIRKNKLTLTELEQKLEEATSNEHCHANVNLLNDIADKTSN